MNKKRILVVEDEAVTAMALKSNLIDLGYEVVGIVTSGEAAIRAASELYPDLVLMDITLDGAMDGIEAADKIWKAHAIPIIYLTAHADVGMVNKAKTTEPFGYLPKPCSTDSLMSAIEVALYKGEADAARRKAEEALKKSEDKFRTLFEKTSEGIFYLSLDGSVVNANDAYARMHGYCSEEILKIPMKEIDPEFESKSPERMRRILAGEQITFEVNHVHKDGHIITLEVSTGLYDFDEKKLIVAFHRDITERKQAELALKEAEWKFRALFDNGPIGVAYHRMIYDDAGKPVDYYFIDANANYLILTGVDPRGRTVLKAFPGIEKDPFDWIGTFGRVARTGVSIHFEQYLQFNDRWYDVVGYQYKPDHFVAAFLEITKRKKAEEEVHLATQRLQIAARSAKLGIWDWDIVNNTMVWDDRMLELYGLTRDTFEGIESWQNGLHPDDRDRVIEESHAAMRGDKEWDTDFRVVHPDRTVLQLKANGIVIRDSAGTPVRMLGVNFDITEHRRLENQLRQSQKMESIGTLAGGVAHDFNNMLTAIIGYGNITLMKMAPDDPNRSNIEQILQASDRAAHLTKDLLLFSRKQPIERKPVDLNEGIQKLGKFLARVIGEDINFKTLLSGGVIPVFADENQIGQVLMNFATNAHDAMPKGGTFTITTEQVDLDEGFTSKHDLGQAGKYALISVSDTGHGMDEATRQRIFEPFFTTKEVGKGTGLGLAVVYGIIKQHEGHINVYSEPGHGTTFKIYLPIIVSDASEEKVTVVEERPMGGTETILLAEDNESVRTMTEAVLKEFGYAVITAVDGEDAVNKYQEHRDRIQLLLFDLIMPKKNGKEAYDDIRKIRPDIKTIFASGYSPDIVQNKASLEDGATIVYKPITPKDLLKKVRSVLNQGKGN